MTKSRGILPPRQFWTAEQIDTLRARYPHEKTAKLAAELGVSIGRVYAKAAELSLKKTPEYYASPDACRLRRGDNIGAAFHFQKGHVPANKGKKGFNHPGMQATQFKKGQRPHTWQPIGSERHSKEGYLQRKVTDTGYPPRDWVGAHILLWREHHGEIPAGHKVVFKDRNKQNITIQNLELLSNAEMMKRNSYHNYPKEIAQIIQLRGAVNRQIKRRNREHHTGGK